MGAWGFVLLVAGALVLAVAGNVIGRWPSRWAMPIVTATAAVGGFVGSETSGDAGTSGWTLDGLFIIPALIGAIVAGSIVALALRNVTPCPRTPRTPRAPTTS